ncbi:unnamed protein product [Hymenolepis diminuta]|uniref:HIT-type domain-containing protein n=1 Tax=Hymenolepis diminuta TaxID=6216 RepID=A0A0R3S9P0_HYMDI|nr:unnamed protein product [Hymenolepis diminuta]
MELASVAGIEVITCKICVKNRAKYTCPRCSINYCSLSCYRDRRHSKCSEKFYRDCCENAIKDLVVDDEKRQQIECMLTHEDERAEEDYAKYESEGSDEESSSEKSLEDLTERIKDIDLTADNIDVDEVWKLLSQEEKREFHRQIATGSIYSSVPVWTPWWQSASRKLINSFPDDFVEEPAPKDNGSHVDPLSKFFNGDHLKDMRTSACDLLLKLVSYLQPKETTKTSSNKTQIIRTSVPLKMIVFSDFSEVIASLQSRLAQNHLACSHKLMLLLTDDLHCMLQNFDSFVIRALNELIEVFSHVKARSIQFAAARHKIKFLRSCVGKQDEASRKWYGESVPTLLLAVETSICEQTMRIETEDKQFDPAKSERRILAGPNWRNMIRDNANQNNRLLIKEIDLPYVSNTDM